MIRGLPKQYKGSTTARRREILLIFQKLIWIS